MDYTIYYVGIPVIVAIAVIGWLIFKHWQKQQDGEQMPVTPLPLGWQFYSNLTNGEPPGTIFRLTRAKQRFIVNIPKGVSIHSTQEVNARINQSVQASMGMFAKFLGLSINVDLKAEQAQSVVFIMDNSTKESTYDTEIDKVIKKALEEYQYKRDERYFVIRDTKSTKEIDYELTRDQVDSLGGEAKIQEAIEAKTTVFSKKGATKFELKRKFDEPMRVMFNAEEINVKESEITFGGVKRETPEFTRNPVKEHLEWTDAQ
jgi:hypothetical protein